MLCSFFPGKDCCLPLFVGVCCFCPARVDFLFFFLSWFFSPLSVCCAFVCVCVVFCHPPSPLFSVFCFFCFFFSPSLSLSRSVCFLLLLLSSAPLLLFSFFGSLTCGCSWLGGALERWIPGFTFLCRRLFTGQPLCCIGLSLDGFFFGDLSLEVVMVVACSFGCKPWMIP